MSKSNPKVRKSHQCCVCGFNAARGSFVAPEQFVCRACDQEMIGEAEARYDDEEFIEMARIESYIGRCDYM